MNLADVIASFSSTYTVTRKAQSTVSSGGLETAGSTSSVSITACVQPLTGRELMALPEGMRTQELMAVWSTAQLFAQDATHDSDLISIDGYTFEVQKVERWNTLGNYWKAIVAKVGR